MIGVVGHLRSLPLQSSTVGSADRRRFGWPRSSPGVCRADRRGVVPKLEPFSRSRIERLMDDPPLLKKTENNLSDYCCTLEGDECYSCWKAYFEFLDLEQMMPKEDLEKLVRGAGGIKTLIGVVHGLPSILGKDRSKAEAQNPAAATKAVAVEERPRPFPIPDGLPKTAEELEEEEGALMPDSPWTRLLRARGRMPEWYTPRPDHETD